MQFCPCTRTSLFRFVETTAIMQKPRRQRLVKPHRHGKEFVGCAVKNARTIPFVLSVNDRGKGFSLDAQTASPYQPDADL